MNRQRPDTWLSSQPAADDRVVDSKRACRTTLITGPLAGGNQRSVRHSDGWQLQLRTEVQRQSRSSRMITSSRVQQQRIKITGQRPYGPLHQPTDSQGHQPRYIGSVRGTADHLPLDHPAAKHDHCCRPCSVMISARTGERTRKAHPATADHGGAGVQAHRIRRGGGQRLLIVDQRVSIRRPHTRHPWPEAPYRQCRWHGLALGITASGRPALAPRLRVCPVLGRASATPLTWARPAPASCRCCRASPPRRRTAGPTAAAGTPRPWHSGPHRSSCSRRP
jgi:hypothetical protein